MNRVPLLHRAILIFGTLTALALLGCQQRPTLDNRAFTATRYTLYYGNAA